MPHCSLLKVVGVKRVVQEKLPEGVSHLGLTLTGFPSLHALFMEKGRLDITWTVLRKSPDQSVELTSEAVEFLRGIFSLLDIVRMSIHGKELQTCLWKLLRGFGVLCLLKLGLLLIVLAACRAYAARKKPSGYVSRFAHQLTAAVPPPHHLNLVWHS